MFLRRTNVAHIKHNVLAILSCRKNKNMERDNLNKLFDYYFSEIVKEESNEVWDAQEEIINFCEFVITKLNISDKDKNITPYSEWAKKLRDL